MKHNYEFELTKVVKQAQRDVMYAALDAIQAENDNYERILNRGYELWMNSRIEKWDRIRQQRDKIWLKIHTNAKAMDLMWKTLHELV